MKQDEFLKKLAVEGYPAPELVTRDSFGFLELDARPYEVVALVIEGQIDISINGYRAAYLAGDCFYLPANQAYAECFGSKGVRYLVSRGGFEGSEGS